LITDKDVLQYKPLVQKVVNKLSINLPPFVDKEDLNSYGYLGLIEAFDHYDPQKGMKFLPFAYFQIKHRIFKELERVSWLPKYFRKKAKKIQEIQKNFELNSKSEQSFNWWLQTNNPFKSLEETEYNIVDDKPCPDISLEKKQTKKIIFGLIKNLPEKEKKSIFLYYYKDLTQKKIAERMQLSPERIQQLHSSALSKLRNGLANLEIQNV